MRLLAGRVVVEHGSFELIGSPCDSHALTVSWPQVNRRVRLGYGHYLLCVFVRAPVFADELSLRR